MAAGNRRDYTIGEVVHVLLLVQAARLATRSRVSAKRWSGENGDNLNRHAALPHGRVPQSAATGHQYAKHW